MYLIVDLTDSDHINIKNAVIVEQFCINRKNIRRIKKALFMTLEKCQWDYILLRLHNAATYTEIKDCLQTNGISEDRILDYNIYAKNRWNNPYSMFLNQKIPVDYYGYVLGMSHSQSGLDIGAFREPFYMFSCPSVDLTYQYNVLNSLSRLGKLKKKVVILELPYYIFNYDLSLASNIIPFRVLELTQFGLDTYHNLSEKMCFIIKNVLIMRDLIGDDITDNKQRERFVSRLRKVFQTMYVPMVCWLNRLRNKETKDFERNLSHVWKNEYESTIKENKIIWEKMVDLISVNECRMTVVVFPHNPEFIKHYAIYIDKKKKCFYDIIEKNITVLDFFECDALGVSCFTDECHLNEEGRIIFSKMLKSVLDL